MGLACAVAVGSAAAEDLPSAAERAALVRVAGSVLRVEAPSTDGTLAVGSAVTVADERVVTNCHVTRNARKVFVIRGGVRWEAQAQAADIERDLCLLHVHGLVSSPVPIGATAALAVGERVAAIGYTGGAMLQRGLGGVLDLHRHDGSRVIKSSSWFSSGASGGGLFDRSGALVGILTFRLRGGDAHWFAAPVEWVRPLLDAPSRPLAPLDASRLPYWQQPLARQPRFLRAAVMQARPRVGRAGAARARLAGRRRERPRALAAAGRGAGPTRPRGRCTAGLQLRTAPGARPCAAARQAARVATARGRTGGRRLRGAKALTD